jgi:predicted AAA+ superfamily ATPase
VALSNRERVGRVMGALKDGLGPFIVREYRLVFKRRYVDEIEAVLATVSHPGLPGEAWSDEKALLGALDTQGCLNLMWRRWNDVFQEKLGHVARSYVSEMIEARNNWAHQSAFNNDEAYRVADTAARLLKMVSAADEAALVDEIGRDLLRLRYEAEAKKAKKDTGPLKAPEQTTLPGLKPWREVVQPHPDVASGRYIQAEFAADLAQVMVGSAEPEYQDPLEFFRRTYLTEGLLALLVTGVKRLTAQGGDPVVQLQTAFGGGKTHSMLALYHLCGGGIRLSDFPGGERIAEGIGDVDLPEANVAALVGTALDPARPREYPDATVHTLWGELAYQLGGPEGYKLVEHADLKGVSPGSDTLSEVLFQFGPCLVIVDELVAYARNLYGVERLPAGSFESIMTFMQSLTEAVRRSDESILLVSVPASDIEIGGEAGKTALETLSHIVGRIESVWKPITATESFEIVRRRLFATQVDHAARDAVINAFGDMYRNASGEFPSGVPERDYLDRMRAAYPIHPELFDRLYQDWSTLERFQRTRGVLRLMAAVIHQLWTRGDQSLLIMPGTLPLDTSPVRNELLRYLPDTWDAVYDTDIDGPESRPFKIDGDVPALGRYNASRRVARTVFIGSAPSVAEQRVRGLEEIRLRLGCAQPGEPTAVFGDALRRMSGQLTYLYTDGSRYWYDTRPTVNKLARDRAQAFSEDELDAEIIERLRRVPKNRDFAAFHVAPPETSDVADEARARIIVLRPESTHKRATSDTQAIQDAGRFLESRGNAQRLYKNMLVFVAIDENETEALRLAVRDFLAWGSIQDERDELNLDAQQRRQVATSLAKADETVDLRLRSAYNWLLVPTQPDPLGPIEIQASRISGDDNFYDRAARKLRNDGLLIYEWSPDILRMELDRYIWGEERGWEVRLRQLWEYLAQYCYLPRLFDHEVLVKAVRDGVGRLDAPFAYATGKSDEGHHTGLVFRTLGYIYFDEASLLVHPDHISEPPEVKIAPPKVGEGEGREGPGDDEEIKVPEPPKKVLARYYGRVEIDPKRVNKDVGLIVEEVIERLTGQLGCEVEITLEIDARQPEGFDESTVRTISENSRTLKFENYGFEEG